MSRDDRFKRGAIYRFNYLWSREHERGEETVRKERPTCLLLRPEAHPDILVMFPITSQLPRSDQTTVEVPSAECRRGGLYAPAWIVLDEYNLVHASRSPDFISLDPMGSFSDQFLQEITTIVVQRIRSGMMRAVHRN